MFNITADNIQFKTSPFVRSLVFSFVCGVIGATLNLFPIFLFSDLTLIFGPAFSILIALSIGPWWGAFTALIASSTLILSWEHYYGFLIFIPEAYVVGALYRKRWNELLAVLTYWCIVAIPFVFALIYIKSKPELALDLSVKYLLNSSLYTLIASALLWFFSVPNLLQLKPARTYSLRTQIFTILMVSMTVPIAAFSIYKEQQEQYQLVEVIHEKMHIDSHRIAEDLDEYLRKSKLVIENYAKILELSPNETLHSSIKLNEFHQLHPEFISILLASEKGLLTAVSLSSELKVETNENTDINQSITDREYFHQALQRKTFISKAFKSRPKEDPIVTISTPVISPTSGEVVAVLGGSLNLYKFDSLIHREMSHQTNNTYSYLVLDSDNKVIFASPKIKTQLLQRVDWSVDISALHPEFFETPIFDSKVISGGAIAANGWQVYALYPESDLNLLSREKYHEFAFFLSLIIILVGFLAIFLSYQLNAPIQWLFKRIVDFNVTNKNLETVQLSPLVPKELVTLIRAHESAEKRLRHAFYTEQLLQEKRITAEKANEAKSNFLSAMSHELRTPLNAISGFSQLLVLEESIPKESKELVNEIAIASQHLMLLINDILDMSKIESGSLQLNNEEININELLVSTIPLIISQAKARNVRIIHDSSTTPFFVFADKLRLKQVLINLLSNAIKYNLSGGEVRVTVSVEKNKDCMINILDTGVGIDKEHINGLFKIFNRLDKEGSETEGYGIGLVISKKLVELMAGKISVKSEINKGSCFSISLPLLNKTAEVNQVSADLPTKKHKPVIRECRILYIEDNDINALVMAKAMQRYPQINFSRERDGDSGLERIKNEFFDFVLLDISLPDMDGYQILAIMQNQFRDHYQTVFAVSANAMSEDILKGLAAGFDQYVTKPLKFEAFFDLLRQYQSQ